MKLVAWFLLLTLPSTLLMGDTNGALLIGSGPVQINGEQSEHSSTVLNGDRIQTTANSSALIKSSRGVVTMKPDSTISYDDKAINFEGGTVVVDSPKNLDSRVGNLLVHSEKAAKYALVRVNGADKIFAIEGSIKVTDGIHTANLKAGQALVSAAYEQHDKDQNKNDKRRNSADELPVASGIPGYVVALIVFAPAIAIGVYGIAGGFNNYRPASPSSLH